MSKDLEKYLRPRPTLSPGAWIMPVIVLAAAGLLASKVNERAVQTDMVRKSNDMLRQARARTALPKPTPKAVELQKRWDELKDERDFPWDRVFNSVERADRSNIELLEFRPDKRNRRVILRGEAQDRDAVTAYLEELARQRTLARVHILQLQTLHHDGLTTYGFEIKATIR
jgi:hypothetical protein